MKLKKPVLSCLALLLCLLICVPVFAIENVDESKTASLIIYSPEELKNDRITYSIYLVAQMDRRGNLTTTGGFTGCAWEKSYMEKTDNWSEALQILMYWVEKHPKITPTEQCIADACGTAVFPGKGKTLTKGLYLVTAMPTEKLGCTKLPAAFLVSVPDRDENDNWIYTMTAEPKAVETSITVQKYWDDEGHTDARPASVSVNLTYGSSHQVYSTATLSPQNGWSYTWFDLPAGYNWGVQEGSVENYSSTVTKELSGFVLVNQYVSPTIPQTGQITWPIPLLTAVGLVLFVIGFVRYRKSSHEEK